MAEISEAVARAICKALERRPDDLTAVYNKFGRYIGGRENWRIVQRAAAEAEDKP